jgi:hypothetical protein
VRRRRASDFEHKSEEMENIKKPFITDATEPFGERVTKSIYMVPVSQWTLNKSLSELSIAEDGECKGPQNGAPVAGAIAWVCVDKFLLARVGDVCHLNTNL